ncbi:MAG: hypothetical protein WA766_11710 [Candidatus Acidiferrales bacterium]
MPTRPWLKIVDTETTGLSTGHKYTGLLQLYASNLPPFLGARPFDPRTLVKPSRGYAAPNGKFIQFENNFAQGQDVLDAANKVGVYNEEEMAGRFFSAASQELKARRRFLMAGWNPGYDTGVLEALAQRYSSLSQYRGFFQQQGVKTFALEKPFLEVAHAYGKVNPEFAQRYFRMGPSTPVNKTMGPGMIAQTPEQMRYVPGWSVENIARAVGGREKLVGSVGQFHEAVTDVNIEKELFERFRLAKKVAGRGYSFDQALGAAGVLPGGQTAETFFKQIFGSSWQSSLANQAEKGIRTPIRPNAFAGVATKVLLVAATSTAAYAIATSTRKERQTQITGLADTGYAAKLRHDTTDFGSGWQGKDSPSWRTAETLVAGAGIFAAHKFALRHWAGYAEGLYQTLKTVEQRSPSELFRTFGLSQLASSYTVNEIALKPEQIFFGQELTATGKHLERLLGFKPNATRFKEGMRFVRTDTSSPYFNLVGDPGYKIRFAERGRLTASSARYGATLSETVPKRPMAENFLGEIKEAFVNRQHEQYLRTPLPKKEGAKIPFGGEERVFQPLYGRGPGLEGTLRGAVGTAERTLFEAAERPLRLLGNIGLGLPYGSYNKLMHIPGVGEGGMLNKLLTHRVLPIYLGVTAARYINYKLDNKPAEKAAEIPLKAHLAWAEATDRIPGLRSLTDKYEEIVPGPQYGPLALPIGAGALATVVGHYLPVMAGTARYATHGARAAASRTMFRKGFKWGALATLPFLPGMLGSRQTADELRRVYSGEEEVPIRSGRWWDVGSTPFQGGRIKYFRPHWYQVMKNKSEMIATYGSEDAYWEHHPLLHPIKYIKDPYWLERANYYSRPYPITSPAFSNVPLVGHALAATIGRVVKPAVRMHEQDWDINNYTLYSPRLEPNMALGGLAPSKPREEFSFKDVAGREALSFAEYTGLPGFIATTIYGKTGSFGTGTPGKDVILQGSRQMTSWTRAYYQRELGAVSGLNPSDMGGMPFGYSEPLRRFIQPDKLGPQANEIPNTMPRWLPGEDYMLNFRTGDPYAKIPEGGTRLPGPGYAALHPELENLKPEEYPTFYRYKILADVAPWSKEYMIYKAQVRKQAQNDTRIQIEYDKIEDQVRQMKESTVTFAQRRFTEPVETIAGTIKRATPQGIELSEFPGRTFSLSSLGTTAADMSAVALGEQNNLNKTQVVSEVDRRMQGLQQFLQGRVGQEATLVVPLGTEEHATEARAVVFIDDVNVNQEIIDKGLGRMRKDYGGAEAQAMYSSVQQSLGRYAETLAFTGEGGPLRFVPTPFHTKYWNERTALSLYQEQEVYGSRMRRWQKPYHDMVAPWARGLYRRITGETVIPEEVRHRRDIDEMVDELDYLRGQIQAAANPTMKGRYTSQSKRTNIGGNLFGSPSFVATTLPRREKIYFQAFLQETDPDKRQQILESVSPDLARALTAQWVKKDAMLARAAGKEVPAIEQGGVLFTKEGLSEYQQAKTDLTYSDYMRSKRISEIFSKLGFNIPGPGSPLWSEGIDYEDVKLKIVQNEGYDYHDFNIYDDRAALLWRKPYIDGAVRELTSGGENNAERIRQTVERIIVEGQDKNPSIGVSTQNTAVGGSNVAMNIDEQGDEEIMRDVRRNSDEYREDTAS